MMNPIGRLAVAHSSLSPGFTWITWPSFFLGLLWSFICGWYVAVVFAPLFNFFAARTQ
jgi:hypothetical protein